MFQISTLFHRSARALRMIILSATFVSLARAQGSDYFILSMDGAQETPPNSSTATGGGCAVLDFTLHKLLYSISFSGLSSPETGAAIHCCGFSGQTGPVLFTLPLGSQISGSIATTSADEMALVQGAYVEIDSMQYPSGEIRGQLDLPPLVPPLKFCFGDGSGTACPCGNASAVGAEAGCLNSFGTAGTLRTLGFASLACDDLSLHAAGMPPSTTALFFQGTGRLNGGGGAVFGDGLRCTGGSLSRIATVAVSGGVASYPAAGQRSISTRVGLTTSGARDYQAWYRNVAAFCQPEGFNLTNAVQILWSP